MLERLGVWTPLAAQPGAVTPIVDIDISQARGFGSARLTAADAGAPRAGLRRPLPRAAAVARRRARAPRHRRALGHARRRAWAGRPRTPRSTSKARPTRCSRGWRSSPTAPAPSWPASSAGGTTTASRRSSPASGSTARRRGSRSSASPPTAPSRCCRRATTTGSSGPPSRVAPPSCSRSTTRRSSRGSPDTSARGRAASSGWPTGAAFRWCSNSCRGRRPSRTVVIGNAAQTLHPVAGQGFNVGLRDAFELSRVIVATPRDALGERAMLDRYASRRRTDRVAGIAFTHGLVHPVRRRPRACCAGRAAWGWRCSTRCRRRSGRSPGRCCSACAEPCPGRRRPGRFAASRLICVNRRRRRAAGTIRCVRGIGIIRLPSLQSRASARPNFVRIGPYELPNNLAVAPMAGVTDRPFRQLCRRLGAGYAVSEMLASNPLLRDTAKSRRRGDHAGEPAPDRRADRRRRSGADGRRRPLQRRPRRADHRHQHGLSGEEGLQRRGRFRAAGQRGAGGGASSPPSSARSTCRSR